MAEERFTNAIEAFEHSIALMKASGDERALGHNYAYLAFAYIGLKRYARTLDAALIDLRHGQDVRLDAEHGRSHLAVAIVLERHPPLSAEALSTLAGIARITGLASEPTAYLEAAIEIAALAGYHATLVPALREHARCMFRKGNRAAGREKLEEARERAAASHMQEELHKIERIYRDLGIRLPGQGPPTVQLPEGIRTRSCCVC